MNIKQAIDKKGILKKFKSISDIDDLTILLNDIGKNQIGNDFNLITSQELLRYSFTNPISKHYKTFSIKKKSGKYREICAPFYRLKRIQKCISLLLSAVYDIHPSATGFVPGKSIVDNAKPHVGKKYVYNIDLEDFFPSIYANRLIARLQYPPFNLNEKDRKFILAKVIGEICTINVHNNNEILKSLPQGAPSSPVLSNIICQKLDFYLSAVAKRFNCTYSRYADDITFSSDENVFDKESEFIKELSRIITDQSFKINFTKTRLQSFKVRQEVTGLVVNKCVNVKKEYIKEIRMWLYYWESYGYPKASNFYSKDHFGQNHLRRGGLELINVLHGKLQYLKMIKGYDNTSYKKLETRFNKLSNNFSTEVIDWMNLSGKPGQLDHKIQFKGKLRTTCKRNEIQGRLGLSMISKFDRLSTIDIQSIKSLAVMLLPKQDNNDQFLF